MFEPLTLLGVLEVFFDADHAGDLESCKSRSGMAVMWRSHLMRGAKHHSVEQWRVRILRIAQIFTPMHLEPKQC